MRISKQLVDELIAHAREEVPNECCGMIGGVDGEAKAVYRTRNVEASPLRYGMDGQEQYDTMKAIEDAEQELAAIYHSHTASAAYPSQTDVNLAAWPDAMYVIVSLQDTESPEVRGFWIRDGRIEEADLEIE